MIRRAVFVLLALSGASCDLLPVDVDQIGTCSDVCTRVDECEANPPSPQLGNLDGSSGEASLDCAANCAQDDRALYGYSDCQLDCLQDAPCDQLDDCWRPKSEIFAKYCLGDRDIPKVQPDPADPVPSNGSNSGSEDADDVLEDPANEIAVDESDFDVNFGDQPPVINGQYDVFGSIDESDGARPPGSLIDTRLCFWGQEGEAGGNIVTYCEDYVPGRASAPVTGSGDQFTVYLEYPGQATLLFSGKVNGQGRITESEALVVYSHSVDVWEHSVTDWSHQGECDSCAQ
jgi:hypothetical protein